MYQMGHLIPLVVVQVLLFILRTIKYPKESVLDILRTILLYVSYALMVPVIRYVFFFVGISKLYFLSFLFSLLYLLFYNYDYYLTTNISSNNMFNIDKANICITYLGFLFARNLSIYRTVLLLMSSNM